MDAVVKEDITIHKSVTVRSAAGHHGTIRSVQVSSSTRRLDVNLTDLTIKRGIDAFFEVGASGHRVELRGIHAMSAGTTAVEFFTAVPDPGDHVQSARALGWQQR